MIFKAVNKKWNCKCDSGCMKLSWCYSTGHKTSYKYQWIETYKLPVSKGPQRGDEWRFTVTAWYYYNNETLYALADINEMLKTYGLNLKNCIRKQLTFWKKKPKLEQTPKYKILNKNKSLKISKIGGSFLVGLAGTGKTTLQHSIHGNGDNVTSAAPSDIAAILLHGGRTVRSIFKIPHGKWNINMQCKAKYKASWGTSPVQSHTLGLSTNDAHWCLFSTHQTLARFEKIRQALWRKSYTAWRRLQTSSTSDARSHKISNNYKYCKET